MYAPTQQAAELPSPNIAHSEAQQPTMQQPAPTLHPAPGPLPYQQYSSSYGQPFQPYQAPPLPQQMLPHEPVPNEAWDFTKLGLHVASIACCIIAIGLSFSFYGKGTTGLVLISCTPVLFFALIWCVAELITRCARKFKAGIHPGAHVGVSLLIWLAAGVIGSIEVSWVRISSGYSSSDCWNPKKGDYDYSNCKGPFEGRRGAVWAIAALTCLVWFVHFILFVIACIDTSKRNAMRRRPMYIVAPQAYWAPPAQGQYMAVPQQQQEYIPLQSQDVDGPAKEGVASPTHVTEYYTPNRA